jgi:hypothetical protein
MSLPKLDVYAFPVIVPSTGKTVSIRPYLVREEKLLLMAQESENPDDQAEAIAQIIRNCTDGVVEPKVTPYFNIEYLLLQLRARSVGEVASPIYQCNNITQEGAEPCGHKTTVKVNLLDINVSNLDQPKEKFIINATDRYVLHLRYPTIYTIHKLAMSTLDEDGNPKDAAFMPNLCDLLDRLEDKTTTTFYEFENASLEEKLEFLESLSPKSYDQLVDFLDSMPTVTHTINFTCERCQFAHTITLSGVMDFLD